MDKVIIKKITNPSKEILELTTNWMYNWWGIAEKYNYNDVLTYMTNSFNENKLPQTYLLYLNDIVIGMYQITYRDLFIRPDIYPWIANLYVDEKYRGKGYGKILIESIKKQAMNNTDFDKLYLYSSHNNLYEKYGWKYVETVDSNSKLYELSLK